MPHSKEWAITPNGGELDSRLKWNDLLEAIGKSRYINMAIKSGRCNRINRDGLKISLACEELREQEPASLRFPLLACG